MAEYKYDAWGNIIAEPGIYYLLARYYDADTGRSIPDGFPQKTTKYY